MSKLGAIDIAVFSAQQEDADTISRTLRNAGEAAHCSWVSTHEEFSALLQQSEPELIFVFANGSTTDLSETVRIRSNLKPHIALMAVADSLDERTIADSLNAGADDVVSLKQALRLTRLTTREIEAQRNRKNLDRLNHEVLELTERFTQLVNESSFPMVYVNEGIIVHANRAWAEHTKYDEPATLSSTPIMDLFDESSRSAIKGALMSCFEDKWKGHKIPTKIQCQDGSWLIAALTLDNTSYEGERCVRIIMEPAQHQDSPLPASRSTQSLSSAAIEQVNSLSFLKQLESEVISKPAAGVRALAFIKLDNIARVRDSINPMIGDALVARFSELMHEFIKSQDLCGQLGGDVFIASVIRSSERDINVWADQVRRRVAKEMFEAEEKSLTMSVTIGITLVQQTNKPLFHYLALAQTNYLKGRDQGGNRVVADSVPVTDKTIVVVDKIPVKQIKNALKKNRFRLSHQPIASLNEGGLIMYDIYLRMLDDKDQEIMPADFMPVAERHGLMRAIDRWVIANTIVFCKEIKIDRAFIRLSRASIEDDTLAKWVQEKFQAMGLAAEKLVFQITELNADDLLKASKLQIKALHEIGCLAALEHFGVGESPLALLEHLTVNYIKIDGSLLTGITENQAMKNTVRDYIEIARKKEIETVAERIEDADTMATVWQLGIEYMQGFYVQGPESVVMETA